MPVSNFCGFIGPKYNGKKHFARVAGIFRRCTMCRFARPRTQRTVAPQGRCGSILFPFERVLIRSEIGFVRSRSLINTIGSELKSLVNDVQVTHRRPKSENHGRTRRERAHHRKFSCSRPGALADLSRSPLLWNRTVQVKRKSRFVRPSRAARMPTEIRRREILSAIIQPDRIIP